MTSKIFNAGIPAGKRSLGNAWKNETRLTGNKIFFRGKIGHIDRKLIRASSDPSGVPDAWPACKEHTSRP